MSYFHMKDPPFWLIVLLLAMMLMFMHGCACDGGFRNMDEEWCQKHDIPPKSQSWDQENLKRKDVGCPTAIYIAPKGELEQCL